MRLNSISHLIFQAEIELQVRMCSGQGLKKRYQEAPANSMWSRNPHPT